MDRRAILAGVVLAASAPALAEDQSSPDAAMRRLLERYSDLWSKRDPAAFALYHDDIVLHWFGANALTGSHTGKREALTALREFRRRTGRELKQVIAILAGPERGALIVREAMGPAAERIEIERVFVFTSTNNLLRECWVYDSDPSVLDRLIGKA